MAEIVGAALAAHAPLITGRPEVARPEQRDRFHAAFRELGRRSEAAKPDVIVMFVNDHLQNFAYDNIPTFCLGLGKSFDAPSPGGAKLMKIPPRKVPGHPDFAMALLEAGLEAGFDFSSSHEIEGFDEISVPLHFLSPGGQTPIVPIYTNCAAPPLPTLRRSLELGRFVGDFVRKRPGSERVMLVGSGGISHWVGTPETGRINGDFDKRILEHVERGEVEAMADLTYDAIERDAGNGGQELRSWISLLGAVPGWKGEVLAYEGVPEWITGCAVVWVKP